MFYCNISHALLDRMTPSRAHNRQAWESAVPRSQQSPVTVELKALRRRFSTRCTLLQDTPPNRHRDISPRIPLHTSASPDITMSETDLEEVCLNTSPLTSPSPYC